MALNSPVKPHDVVTETESILEASPQQNVRRTGDKSSAVDSTSEEEFKRSHSQITKLRAKLLSWEKDFTEKHKCKASRMDLADRPTISKMYAKYHKLKLQIRKEFPDKMAALDAVAQKEKNEYKLAMRKREARRTSKNPKDNKKPSSLSTPTEGRDKKLSTPKARPGEAITPFEAVACALQTPKKLRNFEDSMASEPNLSPRSMALQMSKLELALEMGTTLELSHAMFPAFDPPDFEAQTKENNDIENSDNYRGAMGAPPPPCFSQIYTSTPIFWNEIQDTYIVPKNDPSYMDPQIRRKLYLQRAFIQASVTKFFGDFLDSRVKIIRLTSSPYDRKLTPNSLPKRSQRVRGFKTISQLKKDCNRLVFPVMPGYHSRSLTKSSLLRYHSLPRDEQGKVLPVERPKDWEDIMFPPPAPKGPDLFPNQLADQRYIDRQKIIQARKEEAERQKKEAPMVHVPLPVRRPRRLPTKNLVSTNFVKADLRRGKMRTGLSTRGNKSKRGNSRFSRR